MAPDSDLPPELTFRPHPLLGWSLTPGLVRAVSFRPGIQQSVGPDGWRVVEGAPADAPVRIGFYGCSFTYGVGLSDAETFPSRLQAHFPESRLANRGVGGYGTVQNYLQFRRDVRSGDVNGAVFCMVSDHRYRNYAHPIWMRRHLDMFWYRLGIEHMPRGRLDRAGHLWIEYIPIWQPSLLHEDFAFVLPDEHSLDRLTIASVKRFAEQHAVPVVIALLDSIDDELLEVLHAEIPDVVDASTPYDTEHTFLPTDIHPNALANELFAERLAPHVEAMEAGLSRT